VRSGDEAQSSEVEEEEEAMAEEEGSLGSWKEMRMQTAG